MTDRPVLIPHLDDVACAVSANESMIRLAALGGVTCGSLMVPPGWYPHYVEAARGRDIDMGIHLTLTSESAGFRWGPVSTRDRGCGLVDESGHMWPTVPEVRANADPEAVDLELRAQLDLALAGGVDVIHLDHHMGAALTPEFVENTVEMAIDYRLPTLFPGELDGYFSALDTGPVNIDVVSAARDRLVDSGLAVGDRFLMGLSHRNDTDPRDVFEHLVSSLGPGTTYLSLHCAVPGDIEQVHPNDAAWRISEDAVFASAEFLGWLRDQEVEIVGMRAFRNAAGG